MREEIRPDACLPFDGKRRLCYNMSDSGAGSDLAARRREKEAENP